VAYWEFRRLWNHLRTASRRPIFLVVQVVSLATIVLVAWLLWAFIFTFPVELRGLLYGLIVDVGLVGPNAVFLAHAVISVLALQAILKSLLGVPLGDQVEPADVDLLFPAPIQPRVVFAAKYLRSIPRRLLFLAYALLAFSPILAFLVLEYGGPVQNVQPAWQDIGVAWSSFLHDYGGSLLGIGVVVLIVFLLGEIGALATHALYCLRRLVDQPPKKRRLLHLLFYVFVVFGTLLLLLPGARLDSRIVPFALFGLASLIVGLATNGSLAPIPPMFGVAVLALFITYVVIQRIALRLTDAVGSSLYEDLSVATQHRGVALGLLARLPITFKSARTPLRALLKKDILTGLRSSGKAFYLAGIVSNFALSFVFILFSPVIHLLVPIPPDFVYLIPGLFLLLLVLIIPLLAIGASDPFQGEYGCIHFLRLARLAPLKVTLVKFCLIVATPFLLAVPFAIYFAAILGDLSLLLVAVAVLPHCILISTSVGTALGSRYPYITRTKSQMPVALLVTYPVMSWLLTAPVVFIQAQFLLAGFWFILLSAVIVLPYTIGVVLVMLTWAARSYLNQE
jgi:hypothetical protein